MAGKVWTATDWVCVVQHRESPCKQQQYECVSVWRHADVGVGGWAGGQGHYITGNTSGSVYFPVCPTGVTSALRQKQQQRSCGSIG